MRRPVWAAAPCLVILVGLAACEGSTSSGAVVERTSTASAPTASAAAPASAQADFVGVWADQPDHCGRNQTWRFTADRLAAAGGVTCSIEGAARTPAGWALQAMCAADGAPRPAALQLATGTDGAMTVSGGPFSPPAPLVRCTPPLNATG